MKFTTASTIAMSLALANVVVATPPACLLSCVASVSTEAKCAEGLRDFSCICETNGSDIVKCLESACPSGDADAAISALKSDCSAQSYTLDDSSSSKVSSSASKTASSSASASSAASSAKASSSAVSSVESSSAASAQASSEASSEASSAKASSAYTLSHSHSSALTTVVASPSAESTAAATSTAESTRVAVESTAPAGNATTVLPQGNGANGLTFPAAGALIAGIAFALL